MISVCLASYNGEKFIKRQVDSIITQLNKDDEIIVSDDNSSDRTIEILKSYNDPRIKIYQGPCKGHPRFNFENALKQANGEYIFLSDQDDEWLDGKVERMMECLNNYDVVISNCYVVDGNRIFIRNYFEEDCYPIRHGFLRTLLNPYYLGCCMAFRKKLLDYALPFPPNISQHDIWLGLCADTFNMNVSFIPDQLMNYKRDGNNFSPMGKSSFSVWRRINFRLYLFNNILKRWCITKFFAPHK